MNRIALVASAVLLSACSNPPFPRGSVADLYPRGHAPALRSTNLDDRVIQVAEAPGCGAAPVLFLHATADYLQAHTTLVLAAICSLPCVN